ncbi:MAG: radical SAM protein [Myxococcales bacterium]|nr:radical SAM protein [Myxococcales bacterium]
MNLKILYRGPLTSCNYGCVYCPFAKTKNTREELAHDRRALERFIDWVEAHPEHRFGILMTPWGEGLIRRWYQEGLVRLSHMANVERAVIQTNLSCPIGWAEEADRGALALWATFHPEWVAREAFLEKCQALHRMGVRLSVGVVGFPDFKESIAEMRAALPEEVYLWINAVKRELDQLTEEDIRFFESVDPLYRVNTWLYPSQGRSCRAGATTFSVDGDGTMRRCHFIAAPIGNIYEPDFERFLMERPCSNAVCRCHIGYVHMDYLELGKVFGSGILERIPEGLNP